VTPRGWGGETREPFFYGVGCGGRGAGETEGDPHPLHHALPLHCLNLQVIRARISIPRNEFRQPMQPGGSVR
jgi:hypothetical protein